MNLFAFGAILKLLWSDNYYHLVQEDALTYLEYLDVQEMSPKFIISLIITLFLQEILPT